uniref:Chorein N-terminal domain-containing protein n=1 Tax=Astyanax mexicanus TaxID=7994 RepID=A0A8B9JLQ2_ASTMX
TKKTILFAKNLSPDKINLSTLKGEGQLTNLELDEEVLQNMLDLPTWLAINKVFCNKAAIRIPWTKLKTHPITLSLDKVVMEMSTCDEPRPPNGPSPIATASGQSEYGFAEKVVEGISLSVNSIVIRISAKAFNASFELSQLQVYSVNTSWVASDLRFTRIQDPTRGEILTFKEVNWQMIRIEADAIQSSEHEVLSAPIRLITNQSKIRVTLKRRMKDCNVVASKLILILDDLLWVLTDSQLKAMVQYAKSLSEAMEKSALQRKSMASDSSQTAPAAPSAQQVHTQQASAAQDQSASMARLFNAYNVCETSHHLQITHLDLHICDDIHAKDRGFSKRIEGGAMQLSFSSITVDYYPFHRAGESCLHWMHYSDATKAREGWARSLLEDFRSNVDMLKNAVSGQTQSSPQHGENFLIWKISTSSSSSFSPPPTPRTQMMSSSIVLRMADFSIYQVSTADQRRSSPKAMISCNKKTLYLPQEMPAIYAEFTEYYFPDGKDYPIPCPNLYVQLNALQLVVDSRSLVWLNLFALDLRQSLEQFMELYKLDDSQKPDEHVDVRVDGLMLKLVIPADQEQLQPDLPRSISVQMSEMVATNTRHSSGCSRSDLESLLQAFREQAFFTSSSSSFPRSSSAFPVLHPVFQRHAHEQDTRVHDVYRGLAPPSLSTNALKTPSATDLWALHFSQFWVDYEGRGRPTPCVDSFPLTLWVCRPACHVQHQRRLKAAALPRSESASDTASRLQRKKLLKEYYSTEASASNSYSNGLCKPRSLDGLSCSNPSSLSLSSTSSSSEDEEADLQVLVHVQKSISAQVSHSQYVFLLRLQQTVKSLQHTLQQDLEQHGSKLKESTGRPFGASIGLLMRTAEVSLLLKPVPSSLDSELSGSRATLEAGSSDTGDGLQNEALLNRTVGADPLSDPLAKDWNDKNQGARLPQSMSSGRLMRDRSQSSFSVSYKNMKKSPSLQSLDNISIDSYLLEDCDSYSLMERDDVSISAFKAPLSEPSVPERATEVEDADDVSVLVLKVHSVCGSLDLRGDNTAVALEVGQVRPNQLGNVSLRQYLNSGSGQDPSSQQLSPEVSLRLESGPGAAAHSPLAEHNGFLQCHLQAFSADFLTTSLRNLAIFLEDDSASQVLPMEITIKDTHVNLKDDGPRDNPSEPEPTPVSLHIHNLLVHRRDDGSFHIGGYSSHSAASLCCSLSFSPSHFTIRESLWPYLCQRRSLHHSLMHNFPEMLLSITDSVDCDWSAGPHVPLLVEENECLKQELSRTKMALAEAQMEKDTLLHQMKSLKLNCGGSTS